MKGVYFISAPTVSKVKIGYGKPEQRIEAMRANSPVPLVLLGCVASPPSLEAQLHSYLIEHVSHREWFHLTPQVRETVAALLVGDFDYALLPPKGRRAWAWHRARAA